MSGVSITGAGAQGQEVRSVIAAAAERTGVSFDYLLAQAKLESGLDPSAKAETSSATGLYQFTQGTWLATLDRHGAEHGLGWAASAIAGGRITDPAMAGAIMDLRRDPAASALMAGELARDHAGLLAGVLGRAPDDAELYLAHFLGGGDATRFLETLQSDPQMTASALLPRAAAANPAIFTDSAGSDRTVAEVMDVLRAKVAGASEGGFTPMPLARPAVHSAPAALPPAGTPPRASMSDSLAAMFGKAGAGSSAPAAVQTAYRRLSEAGL